jgi:TRAP-type C4-dicarboxylate transport system permease small subunit
LLKMIFIISKSLASSASFVSTIFLAVVAFFLFLQVVLRYIFNAALSWPEEASRFVMVWSVMLMASVLIYNRELINVDFFDQLWPTKLKRYRDVGYRVLLVFLLGVLFKESISVVQQGWRIRTTALEIRWFWPYLAIPVGTGLMLFQMAFLMIRDIADAFGNGKNHDRSSNNCR